MKTAIILLLLALAPNTADRDAIVTRIIDGDTYDAAVSLGFDVTTYQRLRLYGVDTPELRGSERTAGIEATNYVKRIMPVGSEVIINTHGKDSFGRWLATVTLKCGCDLGEMLIESGHGKVYKR